MPRKQKGVKPKGRRISRTKGVSKRTREVLRQPQTNLHKRREFVGRVKKAFCWGGGGPIPHLRGWSLPERKKGADPGKRVNEREKWQDLPSLNDLKEKMFAGQRQ